VGDDSRRNREPKILRLAIKLSEQHASLGPHRARTGIDTDSLHRPEVDEHAVVAH
jgi:hypothetical protein